MMMSLKTTPKLLWLKLLRGIRGAVDVAGCVDCCAVRSN